MIEDLLANFEEVPVDRALIVATAIVTKGALVTRNVRDFRKVKRLKLHR